MKDKLEHSKNMAIAAGLGALNLRKATVQTMVNEDIDWDEAIDAGKNIMKGAGKVAKKLIGKFAKGAAKTMDVASEKATDLGSSALKKFD